MNKEQADGKWLQFKGKLKETWGKMTDDDLDLYNGKKDQFFGKLKEQYGLAKEEAEETVSKMEQDCDYRCPSSTKDQNAA